MKNDGNDGSDEKRNKKGSGVEMTKPTVCISRCQTKYPEQPKLLTAGSFTPPRLLLPAFSSTKLADRPPLPVAAGGEMSVPRTPPPMPTIKFLGRLSPAKSLITTPIIFVNLIETPVSLLSPLPRCPHCRSKLLSKKKKICNVCGLLLRTEQLLAGGKLSVAAWQEIQMLLGIPPLLRDLTDKQTGAVRQILDYFVAHCPISRQTTFGDDELKHWLLNHLPAAHRSYLSFFHLTIENNQNNGSDQRGAPALAAKTKLAETFSGENKPPKQNKDKSGRQRHPVSPAVYTEVAARQGSFCYWCGIKVVRESRIPRHNRFLKNNSMLVYLTTDGLREEAIGTIDHLLRITDGGDNQPTNLVISCYPCNAERDARTNAYGRPFARRRIPCHACGGGFPATPAAADTFTRIGVVARFAVRFRNQ